ncbi:CHRD domain-containing protein [Ornithinimicrobium cavernae]|uniref:CHRD domain-containing protein n=1 Tax=Ornithinimicrobium cavernae TaxID=2666047 RepID=UPI000D6960F1|nr:CHRD domain-containing protein [Ornithinimicrobium cavernae]
MRRTALASATALALAAFPLAAAGDAPADTGRPLTVAMTGAAERPGPGDPDGSGTAHFRLNPGQEQICYTLEVSDIAPAMAAHIHVAGTDAPGPVVVPLSPPVTGMSSGCADVDRELVIAIISDPGAYYVNVHNVDFPAGAVRGQLG